MLNFNVRAPANFRHSIAILAYLTTSIILIDAHAFPRNRAEVAQMKLLPFEAVAIVPGSIVTLLPLLLYNAGKTCYSHDVITETAIASIVHDFYGNISNLPDIRTAIIQISVENAAVDNDQQTAAKHFDGESFPEGQERVLFLQSETIRLASHGEYVEARKLVGQALHAIQDFYSHSNWIELGNTRPNPDLGKPGRSLSRLPSDIPACKNGRIITDQLTSGYYSKQGQIPSHKCAHGEVLSGPGIAKDVGIYTMGALPRFKLHKKAAAMAIEASRQYMWEMRSLLPPDALNGLLGVPMNVQLLPKP